MTLNPRRRPELAALTLLCGALAVAWSLVVPTFESPDEPAHWAYVTFLARENRLPADVEPAPGEPRPALYESHQPPLFYAASAALLRLAPGLDDDIELRRNTAFRTGPGEANLFVHATEQPSPMEARPGILVVRLFSAACGVATMLLSYLLANAVFGGRRAPSLAAAALVGLSPQFLFIAGSVNNDAMASLLATAALLPTLRLLARAPVGWWWPAALGALLGAASLAKLSTLALLPLAASVVLWRFWRAERRPSHPIAFGVALIAGGGWYVLYNALRWGDPLLTRLAASNTPQLIQRKTLGSDYWGEYFFQRLFESFWGYFGWFSVALPPGVYRILLVALVGAALGLTIDARNWVGQRGAGDGRGRCLMLLGVVVLANLAAVIQYNLTYSQPQGRFLFPSIAAIAVLLVAGWSALLNLVRTVLPAPRFAAALPGLLAVTVTVGMGGLNLYALSVVHGAYWGA
jgi:4-amino-4-deoxy-L-arabinose transferase-like glycosyltransferase